MIFPTGFQTRIGWIIIFPIDFYTTTRWVIIFPLISTRELGESLFSPLISTPDLGESLFSLLISTRELGESSYSPLISTPEFGESSLSPLNMAIFAHPHDPIIGRRSTDRFRRQVVVKEAALVAAAQEALVVENHRKTTGFYHRIQWWFHGIFHDVWYIWLVVTGTWLDDFSIHLGMSSSQLTFIFFTGVETTNQFCIMYRWPFPVLWQIQLLMTHGYGIELYYWLLYVIVYHVSYGIFHAINDWASGKQT